MSWASRRQGTYIFGVILFFGTLIGAPAAYWYFNIAESCFDGTQNQGETAPDKGGPCRLLDERTLSPHAVLWTRAFSVRDGSYNAIAYVENPNENAGASLMPYRFRLYDERNVLIAEREGAHFIMPGTITPVFEGSITTGQRRVARAYMEFAAPIVWERLYDMTLPIVVESKQMADTATTPRLTAFVKNTSVADLHDVQFVAVVFDTAGNAFAGSSTVVPVLTDGERQEIVFTWPDPFPFVPGRIDVLPSLEPSDRK
jgi:hypothetical protein